MNRISLLERIKIIGIVFLIGIVINLVFVFIGLDYFNLIGWMLGAIGYQILDGTIAYFRFKNSKTKKEKPENDSENDSILGS